MQFPVFMINKDNWTVKNFPFQHEINLRLIILPGKKILMNNKCKNPAARSDLLGLIDVRPIRPEDLLGRADLAWAFWWVGAVWNLRVHRLSNQFLKMQGWPWLFVTVVKVYGVNFNQICTHFDRSTQPFDFN